MKYLFTIVLAVLLATTFSIPTALAHHQPGQKMPGMSHPMKDHQNQAPMCPNCMMMDEMQMMECEGMDCNCPQMELNPMMQKMHNHKERSSK